MKLSKDFCDKMLPISSFKNKKKEIKTPEVTSHTFRIPVLRRSNATIDSTFVKKIARSSNILLI